jgi:hypothetical protein
MNIGNTLAKTINIGTTNASNINLGAVVGTKVQAIDMITNTVQTRTTVDNVIVCSENLTGSMQLYTGNTFGVADILTATARTATTNMLTGSSAKTFNLGGIATTTNFAGVAVNFTAPSNTFTNLSGVNVSIDNLSAFNVSITNLSVRGNASFVGDTSMNNVSIQNLSVIGNASFIGDTSMNNVSIRNLSVIGNASMNDVSINNLSVSSKATFTGDISMNNLSVNNLSINNLFIQNTTFSGTTIFGTFASTPTTIFSTNYNGYFNGIYNTSGVLELGSTTFQRQRLTYNGTDYMSMRWYASPTDYSREAGRFEVFARNTGTGVSRTNGDLNIQFTNTTMQNTDTFSVLSSPNGRKGFRNYMGEVMNNYSSMIFFSSSEQARDCGRFEFFDLNRGNRTHGDMSIEFYLTTIQNNVNIGTNITMVTSSTNNTVLTENAVSVGMAGTSIYLACADNYRKTIFIATNPSNALNAVYIGNERTDIDIGNNVSYQRTVNIAASSTNNANNVNIGSLGQTYMKIYASQIIFKGNNGISFENTYAPFTTSMPIVPGYLYTNGGTGPYVVLPPAAPPVYPIGYTFQTPAYGKGTANIGTTAIQNLLGENVWRTIPAGVWMITARTRFAAVTTVATSTYVYADFYLRNSTVNGNFLSSQITSQPINGTNYIISFSGVYVSDVQTSISLFLAVYAINIFAYRPDDFLFLVTRIA